MLFSWSRFFLCKATLGRDAVVAILCVLFIAPALGASTYSVSAPLNYKDIECEDGNKVCKVKDEYTHMITSDVKYFSHSEFISVGLMFIWIVRWLIFLGKRQQLRAKRAKRAKRAQDDNYEMHL